MIEYCQTPVQELGVDFIFEQMTSLVRRANGAYYPREDECDRLWYVAVL